MATQTIAGRIRVEYEASESWVKAAGSIGGARAKKAGVFDRVANSFWRTFCGLSPAGFWLPHESLSKPGSSLSPMEKARLHAYQQMYLGLH